MKCIYKLNFDSGKSYIGLTSNLNKRVEAHLRSRGKGSPKLEEAWATSNYVGHEVLEETTDLNEREKFWIEQLKPELNTLSGGQHMSGLNHPRSKYSKEQIEDCITIFIYSDLQYKEVGKICGMPANTVSDIVKQKTHLWASEAYSKELEDAVFKRQIHTKVIYSPDGDRFEAPNCVELAKITGQSRDVLGNAINSASGVSREGWSAFPPPIYQLTDADGTIVTLPKQRAKELLQDCGFSKYQIRQMLELLCNSNSWKVSLLNEV